LRIEDFRREEKIRCSDAAAKIINTHVTIRFIAHIAPLHRWFHNLGRPVIKMYSPGTAV